MLIMAYYNPRLKKHFKSKKTSNRAEAGIWAWRKNQSKGTKTPRISHKSKLDDKIRLKATIVIIIVAVLSYFGANQQLISAVIHFFANSVLGVIMNAISQKLVIESGLKWLQTISLSFKIGSYDFSITAFAIAVFIVEKFIF